MNDVRSVCAFIVIAKAKLVCSTVTELKVRKSWRGKKNYVCVYSQLHSWSMADIKCYHSCSVTMFQAYILSMVKFNNIRNYIQVIQLRTHSQFTYYKRILEYSFCDSPIHVWSESWKQTTYYILHVQNEKRVPLIYLLGDVKRWSEENFREWKKKIK